MRLTILGGNGAYPDADSGCSGYLVEHEDFRLLLDPGYATFPKLLRYLTAESVDAVLISHAHPDHCADLSPLLRARILAADPPPSALPIFALPGAVDAVLALEPASDRYRAGHVVQPLEPGTDAIEIGPFTVDHRLLPHFVPNLGFRITAGGRALTYTGDCGPSSELIRLAAGADLLLADSSFAEPAPDEFDPALLGTARTAGRTADAAGVERLIPTHLLPGTDPSRVLETAAQEFDGTIAIARPDEAHDI